MAHMKFVKYADFDYDAENDFHEIFTNCQTQIGRKINREQDLFKYLTFDVSIIMLVQ